MEKSKQKKNILNINHLIILSIISALCYLNSIDCDFVFDDISAIKDNQDLRPETPWQNIFFNDYWGTPLIKEQSHKSYRPLTVLTFRFNYLLNKLRPTGYHVVNVILHIIVCQIYYIFCLNLLSAKMSFLSAMLYVVHPIHCEAVASIVGRAEILSSLFFLSALLLYVNEYVFSGWKGFVAFFACVTCALLSKEQGITVTAVCAVYEVFFAKSGKRSIFQIYKHKAKDILHEKEAYKSMLRVATLMFITFALLFGRFYIMGSQLPIFTRFDNPASMSPTPARQLTYNYIASLNMWLLIYPWNLCCDWTMGTIPIIKELTDIRNLQTCVIYLNTILAVLSALTTTCSHHTNVAIMGISLLIMPFLPAANLLFPVGFVLAERVLYLPSMGFCILITHGYDLLTKRWSNKIIKGFVVILLISHAFKTHLRNNDWKTDYTLFMSGLRVSQQNAKLFNNVGHALENEKRFEEALQYFQKAVAVQADDIGAHINVGRTYNNLKLYEQAERAYIKAKSLLPRPRPGETYQARVAPSHLSVFLSLANLVSRNVTRLLEADRLYQQAISMRSDYVQAYINRGDILMKLNKTNEAKKIYEQALKYDNKNPDIYYNLGVVFLEIGNSSIALKYFNQALGFKSNHEQALLNSAILLQEFGGQQNIKLARERLLNLLEVDVDNDRAFFNLGMLAMDENKNEEAEMWFKKAIKIKEDFVSALFNLALLLTDLNRPLEAVIWLTQLLKKHPEHVKGLMLLGDIYTNYEKNYVEAEKCYKKILEINPNHVQGLHNLCVLKSKVGKLEDAYSCLQQAHRLAPNEDYIQRHLKIVESQVIKLSKKKNRLGINCRKRERMKVFPVINQKTNVKSIDCEV